MFSLSLIVSPLAFKSPNRERSVTFTAHGIKGFVIPTKSFVKIGITKYFVTTTKCLVISTKRLVAAVKFLVAATKKNICCP